mgnify:CR=1 FL=1
MKNWLIEKLGGVSKKEHEAVIVTAEIFRSMLKDYRQRISDGLKEARKDRDELLGRLHSVETSYQTKAEAKDNRNEILNLLREIKADLKEVGQKIERKADK